MDSTTSTWILLWIAVATKSAHSLQCYTCSHNTLDSDNSFLQLAFNAFNSVNNEHCKFENPRVDETEVQIYVCDIPPPNQVSMCSVVDGEVTTAIAGTQLKLKTLTRGCVTVPMGSEEANGGCLTETADDSTAVSVLKKTFESLSIGEVHFDGLACFYRDFTSSASRGHASIWLVFIINSVLLLLKTNL